MIIQTKFKRLKVNAGFHVVGVKLFYVKTGKNSVHNVEHGSVTVNKNTLCEADSSMVNPWWKIW